MSPIMTHGAAPSDGHYRSGRGPCFGARYRDSAPYSQPCSGRISKATSVDRYPRSVRLAETPYQPYTEPRAYTLVLLITDVGSALRYSTSTFFHTPFAHLSGKTLKWLKLYCEPRSAIHANQLFTGALPLPPLTSQTNLRQNEPRLTQVIATIPCNFTWFIYLAYE